MLTFLKNNGLSLVLLAMFALTFGGQYVSGWLEYNEDQVEHARASASFIEYGQTGHFVEAVFENWESEFLQMAAFVILTAFLFQRGSSESKSPDKEERVDEIAPGSKNDPKMPWPVRRGGLALLVYKYSLSIALLLLFVLSFTLHGLGGAARYNADRAEHGQPPATVTEYMESSTFWFESFQNWQSEFLSIFVMVFFTVYLRQIGSPESKPVDTPHSQHAPE